MLASEVQALTSNFYRWECRGRGWQAYPYPVVLEPPFRPFPGHVFRPQEIPDDGRVESLGARIAAFFTRSLEAKDSAAREEAEGRDFEEPAPEPFEDSDALTEFEIALPPGVRVFPGAAEAFLLALSATRHPLAFEIVGAAGEITLRLAARETEERAVRHQLRAFFPEAVALSPAHPLREMWKRLRGDAEVLEFGLGREFMLPLKTFREFSPDPLLPLLGALSGVREGEVGIFQVLFTPTSSPWRESVLRAVVDDRGDPFFLDAPDLTALAREKVASPLFAVALRAGAKSASPGRAWEIIRGLAGGLVQLGRPEANEIVPLAAEDEAALEEDLLARTSHRTGMLLGSAELAGLVHLPHESVRLPALRREARKTKAPPPSVLGAGVTLGVNVHDGETRTVSLPGDLRMRHVHVVGATGTGKSTLLANLILEDIARGAGVGLLDPQGDLVEEILGRTPEERRSEVVLFDPADTSFLAGWNVLHAATEIEKTLLASDLVGVFRRLSTSWGDQMTAVLGNAVLAFLESPEGGTLIELRRFLVDLAFRSEVVRSLPDPEMRFFWEREFPLLQGGKSLGSILTRLDGFLRSRHIRAVVCVREAPLNFRELVDRGGIFLGRISQGALGEENAALLGSLLVSTFHQVTLSREGQRPRARRPFFLYLDEFHHFATPSMAALFSGARKYALGLTVAHQNLYQLESREADVARATLANAATRVIFRVGEEDARKLAPGFTAFEARDLVNLGVGEAIVRVDRAEADFNLRTLPLEEVPTDAAPARSEAIREAMRTRFPREVEPRPAEPPPKTTPRTAPEAPPPGAEPVLREPAVPAPLPPKRATRPKEPVPPLGRGGPEHQYLQELVKRWAESHGYRAVVEEEIPGGRGSVDVALRTDDFSLACEISVTSTVGQEVGNTVKCLEAGFDEVAILALKRPRLAKIEAAMKEKLEAADLARVHVVSPEELFAMLSMRPRTSETVVGGYKVKVRKTPVEAGEEAARSRALSEVLKKSLRRLGGKEKP